MLRLSPILLAVLYGLGMYWFSALRLRKTLDSQSAELLDPTLQPVLDKLARALDIKKVKVHLYEVDPVNGLAAPDGRIFITRGFYNKYKSADVSAE
ncbi:MAG: peptidase M48, partial [Paracoccaceae bacterium]